MILGGDEYRRVGRREPVVGDVENAFVRALAYYGGLFH